MKKEQNHTSNTSVVNKCKYWYRDDIEVCIICGKETHNKVRVYNEDEKGTFFEEGVCWKHF